MVALKIFAAAAFIAKSTDGEVDSAPAFISLMQSRHIHGRDAGVDLDHIEDDVMALEDNLETQAQCSEQPSGDAVDGVPSCWANETADLSEVASHYEVASDQELVSNVSSRGDAATVEELDLLGAPVAVVPLVRQRVPSRSTGKYTVMKSVYHGRVQVGGKVFSTVFDSGSGHLILPGVKCTDKACLKHRQYDTTSSPTGLDIDYDGTPVKPGSERDQLTVNFGTGEVTGVFVKDEVCLADPRTGEFPAESNASAAAEESNDSACVGTNLIVATAMSDNPFNDFSFDGVFGLALPGLSQTIDFNMATQITKSLPSGRQAFSFFFSHDPVGSKIYVGGLLRSNLDGPLSWVPVEDPEDGYWKVALDAVHVSGEPLEMCADGCHGVADTGTSVLAAPTSVVKHLRERFKNLELRDGKCQVPEDNVNGTGTFAVTMSTGLTLMLEPHEFAQPRLPLHADGTNASDVNATLGCELMLMRLDVPAPLGPLVILGEPFLTKYMTLFDVENRRLGFGRSRHSPEPADPSSLVASI
jgi:hypothetical protein